VVKALLSHPSIQVNCGKGKTTPLLGAAQEGREGIVKMLLGCKDVDVEKASKEGHTPALVASKFGHEHIYNLLSARYTELQSPRASKINQPETVGL
jgi:ankyrin repeat protein